MFENTKNKRKRARGWPILKTMAVVHLVKQLLFISLTRVRIQFHRTLIVYSLHKIMNIKRGNKLPPFTLVGSGPLGRAFAPDTRDPYFESFHIFELFNYNWESKLPKPNGSAVKRLFFINLNMNNCKSYQWYSRNSKKGLH